MKKIEIFKVDGDKINRVRRHCPKCGPGVFLGDHNNRFSCGNCGYTEFKTSGKKQKDNVKPNESSNSVEIENKKEKK